MGGWGFGVGREGVVGRMAVGGGGWGGSAWHVEFVGVWEDELFGLFLWLFFLGLLLGCFTFVIGVVEVVGFVVGESEDLVDGFVFLFHFASECFDLWSVGRDGHGHLASVLSGRRFDLGDIGEFFGDAFEAVLADLAEGHFAAAEALDELDFVALDKEAFGLVESDFDIVVVDFGGSSEADFFELWLFGAA